MFIAVVGIHWEETTSRLFQKNKKGYLFLNLNNLGVMTKESTIKLFQDQRVRVHWDAEQEKWYFSIIDVVEVLTDSPRPRKYWNALKTKLKMQATDAKLRMTDVAEVFIDYKNNKQLATTKDTASLLVNMISNPDKYEEVLIDLRA